MTREQYNSMDPESKSHYTSSLLDSSSGNVEDLPKGRYYGANLKIVEFIFDRFDDYDKNRYLGHWTEVGLQIEHVDKPGIARIWVEEDGSAMIVVEGT